MISIASFSSWICPLELYATVLLALAFELRMCFVCAKTMPNDSRQRTIWPFGVMCCLNSVIFLPLGDKVLASFSGLWVILPAACRTPSSPLSISPCLPHGGNYATLCRGFQEGGVTRRLCGRKCVTVRVWWRWGWTSISERRMETDRRRNPLWTPLFAFLLHSSFPSSLTHPPFLHSSSTKVADKDRRATIAGLWLAVTAERRL